MNLKVADFFISTFAGGAVALTVFSFLASSTNMLLAMVLGGLIGMVLVMPLKIILMPFFGAFEVLIPLAIIGMGVGMATGMLSILPDLSGGVVTTWGGIAGFMVASIIYFSNQRHQ